MNKSNKIILTISVLIGGFLSIFASAFPDGLERVAGDKGFINTAFSTISGLIPDYAMPGVSYEPLAVALAGIVGTILTFILVLFLGKILIQFIYYEKNNSDNFSH